MSLNGTNGSSVGPSSCSSNLSYTVKQSDFLLCKTIPAGAMSWACLSILTFFLGFPSSIAVMLELVRRQRSGPSRTTTDIFHLNLTAMDILFNFCNLLSPFNFLMWQIQSLEVLVDFSYSFCLAGRPLFMSCMCLDCYVAVVHPITYISRSHLCYKVSLSSVVWASTLVFGLLVVKGYIDFVSPFIVIAYCMNLVVIVYCDVFVIRALRKAGPGSLTVHAMKQKAFQTVLNSLVMIVLFYLPPVLVYLYIQAKTLPRKIAYCQFALPTMSVPMFTSSVMPLMYLANAGKLRYSCC